MAELMEKGETYYEGSKADILDGFSRELVDGNLRLQPGKSQLTMDRYSIVSRLKSRRFDYGLGR